MIKSDLVRAMNESYAKLQLDAARVEELPILIGDFVKWSACAGQLFKSSGWSIDRYAQLAFEYFASDFAGPQA